MKTFLLFVGILVLSSGLSWAGELRVLVTNTEGDPISGAVIQVKLEDGSETTEIATDSDGVAILKWDSSSRKGNVMVNGSTRISGSIPTKVSFKLDP